MKKLITIALLAAMLLSCFAGCGLKQGSVGAVVDAENVAGTTVPTVDVSGGEYNADTNPTGTYSVYDGSTKDTSWYTNDPDSTEAEGADGKYYINTANELMGLFNLLNRNPTATDTYHVFGQKKSTDPKYTFEGKTIYFMRDFILNEVAAEGETPAYANLKTNHAADQIASNRGYFAGTIDGQGHVISGYYQKPSSNNRGMFGPTYNGTFKNFSVINSYMDCTAGKHAAGLNVFGCGTITYENLYIDLSVVEQGNASNGTAGFLGYTNVNSNYTGTVTTVVTFKNCVNAGDVSTASTFNNAGGFLGRINTTSTTVNFIDCENTGSITASANNAGGFIGTILMESTVTITNSKNTGSVSATNNAGGFIGEVNVGHVSMVNCENTGAATVTTANVGSMIGTSPVPHQITIANSAFIGNALGSTPNQVIGYQTTTPAQGVYNLRYVATFNPGAVDMCAGFIVTVKYTEDGTTISTKVDAQEVWAKTAYTSINGGGNIYTAASFGAEYLYTLEIQNVPEGYTVDNGKLEVTITPFTSADLTEKTASYTVVDGAVVINAAA